MSHCCHKRRLNDTSIVMNLSKEPLTSNIIQLRLKQIEMALKKPISEQRKSNLVRELLTIKKIYKLDVKIRHLRVVN